MQGPDKYRGLKGMDRSLDFILSEMENQQKVLTRRV